MSGLKKLPPEGLAVSVALLHLRHGAEDGLELSALMPMYVEVDKAIKASMKPMQALGFKKMQYANALLLLRQAMRDGKIDNELRIMAAHESLRQALKDAGIQEPSDADIIAHAKASQPAATVANARILGNYR
jgi:hypothetical protein